MDKQSKRKSNNFKILTILAIVASLSLGVYLYTAKDIVLSIDGVDEEIVSYASTVEDFLKSEGVVLDKEAYINIPLDSKLEDNTNIIIKTPKSYILSMDDELTDVISVHTKVEDILKDLNVKLEEQDYTSPDLKKRINIGDEIKVFKIRNLY